MTASHPFYASYLQPSEQPGCPDHGTRMAPLMWPDEHQRCADCGHRYDPEGAVLQTREMPPWPYWLTEHRNRRRARKYRNATITSHEFQPLSWDPGCGWLAHPQASRCFRPRYDHVRHGG